MVPKKKKKEKKKENHTVVVERNYEPSFLAWGWGYKLPKRGGMDAGDLGNQVTNPANDR